MMVEVKKEDSRLVTLHVRVIQCGTNPAESGRVSLDLTPTATKRKSCCSYRAILLMYQCGCTDAQRVRRTSDVCQARVFKRIKRSGFAFDSWQLAFPVLPTSVLTPLHLTQNFEMYLGPPASQASQVSTSHDHSARGIDPVMIYLTCRRQIKDSSFSH